MNAVNNPAYQVSVSELTYQQVQNVYLLHNAHTGLIAGARIKVVVVQIVQRHLIELGGRRVQIYQLIIRGIVLDTRLARVQAANCFIIIKTNLQIGYFFCEPKAKRNDKNRQDAKAKGQKDKNAQMPIIFFKDEEKCKSNKK